MPIAFLVSVMDDDPLTLLATDSAADERYQNSRPSTCQALLLLAIRAFGMGVYRATSRSNGNTNSRLGAMDKGWLYSGELSSRFGLRVVHHLLTRRL